LKEKTENYNKLVEKVKSS